MEYQQVVTVFRNAPDFPALFVCIRIASGGQHHRRGVGGFQFNPKFAQSAVVHRLQDLQQIAVQQRQHHLGFRIAKAAVEFDHLRPPGGEHQAEIKHAPVIDSLRLQGGKGRLDDRAQCHLAQLRGQKWGWSVAAHATGILASVAV